MNKKEILNKLNGKLVVKTYQGCNLKEDNEQLKQSIIKELIKLGMNPKDLKEDENCFRFNDLFWMKSEIVNNEQVIFKVRSKDIITINKDRKYAYCDIPKFEDMQIFENGYTYYPNSKANKYAITYTLV